MSSFKLSETLVGTIYLLRIAHLQAEKQCIEAYHECKAPRPHFIIFVWTALAAHQSSHYFQGGHHGFQGPTRTGSSLHLWTTPACGHNQNSSLFKWHSSANSSSYMAEVVWWQSLLCNWTQTVEPNSTAYLPVRKPGCVLAETENSPVSTALWWLKFKLKRAI